MDKIMLVGEEFPIEFLDQYQKQIENYNLPAQHGLPDNKYRLFVKLMTEALVEKGFADGVRGKRRAKIHERVDIGAAISANVEDIPAKDNEDENDQDWAYDGSGEEALIYFIYAKNGKTKIGKTVDIDRRFYNLSMMSPLELKLLFTIIIDQDRVSALESYFHRLFDRKRNHGEWFNLSHKDLRLVKDWDAMRQGVYRKINWWEREVTERTRKIIYNMLLLGYFIALNRFIFKLIGVLVDNGGL